MFDCTYVYQFNIFIISFTFAFQLVKKLKQAESTIETLSQHVTELSESDSVSRARREHEAVVSTLTQRHQRELLVIKEQLDVARAELSTKVLLRFYITHPVVHSCQNSVLSLAENSCRSLQSRSC